MNWKLVAVTAAAGLAFVAAGAWVGRASAGTTDPGSPADPLVSKSYVDSLVSQLASKSYVDTQISQLAPKSSADAQASQQVLKTYVDSLMAFQVVNVPKGQMLVGDAGTEIILRAGEATIVASANGGVTDVTGGKDLAQNMAAQLNHLLIIPRTDGRGLVARTDIVLMVKGTYSLKAAAQ